MKNYKKLKEIIIARLKLRPKIDLSLNSFNEEKFLKSNFFDRYIDFLKDFYNMFNENSFESLEMNEKTYNHIIDQWNHIYDSYSCHSFPFRVTLYDFVSMNYDEVIAYKEKCAKFCTLIRKSHELYNELLTFYK